MKRNLTNDFHDAGQLVGLILTREDRVSGVELSQNTAKAPDVDRGAIG